MPVANHGLGAATCSHCFQSIRHALGSPAVQCGQQFLFAHGVARDDANHGIDDVAVVRKVELTLHRMDDSSVFSENSLVDLASFPCRRLFTRVVLSERGADRSPRRHSFLGMLSLVQIVYDFLDDFT